jgi:hypothetical protein
MQNASSPTPCRFIPALSERPCCPTIGLYTRYEFVGLIPLRRECQNVTDIL